MGYKIATLVAIDFPNFQIDGILNGKNNIELPNTKISLLIKQTK